MIAVLELAIDAVHYGRMGALPVPSDDHFADFRRSSTSGYPYVTTVAEFFRGHFERFGGSAVGPLWMKGPELVDSNAFGVTLGANGEAYVMARAQSPYGPVPNEQREVVVLGRFVDALQFEGVMRRVLPRTDRYARPAGDLARVALAHNAEWEHRAANGIGERAARSSEMDLGWQQFLDAKPSRYAGQIPLGIASPPHAREEVLDLYGTTYQHVWYYLPSTLEVVSRAEPTAYDVPDCPISMVRAVKVAPEQLRQAMESIAEVDERSRFDRFVREVCGNYAELLDEMGDVVLAPDFFRNDSRRSMATIVGTRWRNSITGPSFRLGHVAQTDEIFLADNGGGEPELSEVHVLGHAKLHELQSVLQGWERFDGRAGSIQWLTGQLFGRRRELTAEQGETDSQPRRTPPALGDGSEQQPFTGFDFAGLEAWLRGQRVNDLNRQPGLPAYRASRDERVF